MDQTLKKKLLLEYGQIILKTVGSNKEYSNDDLRKIAEIQQFLNLSHDRLMEELKDYISGTVSNGAS